MYNLLYYYLIPKTYMKQYIGDAVSKLLHEYTASKFYLNENEAKYKLYLDKKKYNTDDAKLQKIVELFTGLNTMFRFGPRTCDYLYTFRFVPANNINLIIDMVKLITQKEFITNTFLSTTYSPFIPTFLLTTHTYFENILPYYDRYMIEIDTERLSQLKNELKKYITDDKLFDNILYTHNFILMLKIPKDYPVLYGELESEILLPFNSKLKLVDYFFDQVDPNINEADIKDDYTKYWKYSFKKKLTYRSKMVKNRPIRNCYLTVECLPYTKDQFSELEKYSFNPDE